MVDSPVYSFSLMSRNVICSDLRACLLVFLFLHLGLTIRSNLLPSFLCHRGTSLFF